MPDSNDDAPIDAELRKAMEGLGMSSDTFEDLNDKEPELLQALGDIAKDPRVAGMIKDIHDRMGPPVTWEDEVDEQIALARAINLKDSPNGMGILNVDDKVVLSFGNPTPWIGVGANTARHMANSLLACAAEVDGVKGYILMIGDNDIPITLEEWDPDGIPRQSVAEEPDEDTD